ncbi:alpha/beta hydrolase [Nocardioides pelophilus]|uniref:alpha/beta hydrolase n=1 Tax=Nocardioides pelophilus TaxID=2172019 RepID=UPI0028B14F98|nr:alpha/beta fold hydrolase [Nocardioides pelophilus]
MNHRLSCRSFGIALVLITSFLAAAPADARSSDLLFTSMGPRQVRVELANQTYVDPSSVSGRTKDPVPHSGVVQLPVDFHPQPAGRYRLLVLLHGSGGSSTTWTERGDLLHDARLQDVVVLSLDGGHYGMYTNWVRLGGARWLDLHRALINAVIERFSISTDRSARAIVGVSMGGQGALRYAGQWPETFGTVGALSPALPDMRSPEAVAAYPLQVSAKAGTLVRYRDTWGPVFGPRARRANPMDNLARLVGTTVHVTAGDGSACPDGAGVPEPDSAVTEMGIARQTRRYARALSANGVAVTTAEHCGAHGDWRWWLIGLDETLALWSATST